MKATARSHSNIAFIKYWGNKDEKLKIPENSSLSMNLDGVYTDTTVEWVPALQADQLILNDQEVQGSQLDRVVEHLNFIRKRLNRSEHARVSSVNNFPMGAGIASSASAFSALTLAAVTATGNELSEKELTSIARLGSGSASRSIPSGFVEWHQGQSHETSYAESFASPEHWELYDMIAIVSKEHKRVGSRAGHPSAHTSELFAGRLQNIQQRLAECKQAILNRDFSVFADIVEYDSNLMHAVMMTSNPPLFYWLPATLTIMEHVRHWRSEGLEVCYTLDAGPNVHCLCTKESSEEIKFRLSQIPDVENIISARSGVGAHIIA